MGGGSDHQEVPSSVSSRDATTDAGADDVAGPGDGGGDNGVIDVVVTVTRHGAVAMASGTTDMVVLDDR